MLGQECIAKGFYHYKQPSELVSVKNYIFTRKAGKKCLLLRFSNDLSHTVDSMRFTLRQMDATGKVIDETEVAYADMDLLAGASFVSQKAIVVDEFCTDFRVYVNEIRSGRYKYTVDNGAVSVNYVKDKPSLELKGSKSEAVTKTGDAAVRFGKPGLATLLSVFGVLAMLAISVLGLLQAIGII